MLRSLHISNYAIINEARIGFGEGMHIITGETGAGKSILLGALGLILGERADSRVLYQKDKKCVVEGTFSIADYGLKSFFTDNNLDYEEETIIRRELSDNGKSRAFVNDTPVNVQVLQQLASKLITIHSQHETLDLGNSAFQLTVIDALAQTGELLTTHKQAFEAWHLCQQQLEDTISLASRAAQERDFIQFQFEELDKAGLDAIDQEALEAELTQLTHAEEIKRNLMAAVDLMDQGQANIADQLRAAISQLRSVEKYLPTLESYLQRLSSAQIELQDISRDLDDLASGTYADPSRSEIINQLLSAVYRLQKKHQCADTQALIALRDDLGQKLMVFEQSESRIEALTKETSLLLAKANQSASKLSAKRKAVFASFEKQVKALLAEVGMKDAEIKVSHTFDADRHLTINGADQIQFLFSANKGAALQDIKKTASGGELSRLMLCIKSLLAKSVALPSLIFDEIDTGVSGEVAQKVGNILVRLADNHQVIAITHLPQIASKGAHHLLVYKSNEGGSTHTHIRSLQAEERILEIAKMLSGEKPTKAAIENAKELMLHQ
ncbi:MAG TPA: DNA repair protein RecN [Chitinophagales bacterium]|nr:DNA repair protein RecN [Chitinophagales bacterium]HNE45446.1 DNA repair protein RecN [Chitinophagales bacterium]HNF68107.1 DNA repair protein RecN [Chitinophagales bacterium]HNJ88646.1 DNA repair protein RecN [Chitinophagales bacterium]HNK97496.1 DNA repair protein RecN [Chitinophagales bacterium]